MKERTTGRFFDSARFTGSPSACAYTTRAVVWTVLLFIAAFSALSTYVSTATADPPTDDAEDESSVAQTKPMLRPELSWTLEKGLRGAGPRRGIPRLRGNAGQR